MSEEQITKTAVTMSKKILWKVPNFSRDFFESCDTGYSIESEVFRVSSDNCSTIWNLSLYPNGVTEDDRANVSLFLNSAGKEETDWLVFNVKFKFGVAKKDRKDDVVQFNCEPSMEDMETGYGVYVLLSHAELFDENNGFVVDGSLTVFVELEVQLEVTTVKTRAKVSLASSAIAEYKKVFDNEALSDFELRTSDGEMLKAHKVVLAARSPVFFAMLTTDMEEKQKGLANVPDFDSKVMKEFLRFIYYNDVENLDVVAFDLIYAAEKYQIKELKKLCLQQIASKLQAENVVETLMIASQISGANVLNGRCLDMIASNFRTVRKSPTWRDLSKEHMAQIVDVMGERLSCLEI